jgi:DNA-binding NarL/FixJ family response regulator
MLKVLIADDHLIFAQGLAALLSGIDGIEVVAVVKNGQEALNKLSTTEADIVISDLQMPVMSGVALMLQLRQHFPAVRVLALSMTEDVSLIREVFQAGAAGFAFKSIDKIELQNALRAIANGENYFTNDVLRQLVAQPKSNQKDELQGDFSVLSEREIAVLKLIAAECNSNEIAERLFVSVNTVETHRKHLFKKLGVKNALGLIKFAFRNGLAC